MTEFTDDELIHINDTYLSDAHKEAFGFRPRGIYQEWWTDAELQDEYDRLGEIAGEEEERERLSGLKAQRELEEGITAAIEVGAKDRATALRWMFADADDDLDHELWNIGISYYMSRPYTEEILEALGH